MLTEDLILLSPTATRSDNRFVPLKPPAVPVKDHTVSRDYGLMSDSCGSTDSPDSLAPRRVCRLWVQRVTAIAIAVTMASLFVLMFQQDAMGLRGGAQMQSEYTINSNPYLPFKRLEPVW
jgi:hypothetical protein